MTVDRTPVVRFSSQLWSEQVSIVEAADALDYAGTGAAGIQALAEKLQPVIYEFDGGRRRFRALKNPYA
jgi:hypothetical protein